MNRYRMMNQKPEFSREFDIWDPQRISKEAPCRVSDDDPRCGPSSAQKYFTTRLKIWFYCCTVETYSLFKIFY